MTNIRSLPMRPAGQPPTPKLPTAPAARPEVSWQPSLLGAGSGDEPAVPSDDAMRLRRTELDTNCWVDHAPAWYGRADELFDELLHSAPWSARTVRMYGRLVDEPRLSAWWPSEPSDPPPPSELGVLASRLGDRYGCDLSRVSAALYRDGRDSVAYHRDRIASPCPTIAILSLGSTRTLRFRPLGGGPSTAFELVPGDLLVMGGACNDRFEHGVAKMKGIANARISVQFRGRSAYGGAQRHTSTSKDSTRAATAAE